MNYYACLAVLLVAFGGAVVPAGRAIAQDPPAGQPSATDDIRSVEQLNDPRLGPLRTLDSRFPFVPPRTREEWNQRAARLREHLQVSLGLWPMPQRAPLNAVIHGRREMDGYTVEQVYFESFPGFFVTGNLYRPHPAPVGRRVPGVLSPHGHWSGGRFFEASAADIEAKLARGEELLPSAARSHLQARCVHLARMGATVFHYDMIGYADCTQLPLELAHGGRRGDHGGLDADGRARLLFSAPAESHLQSVMGLQTWNSIRALDFLTALPEVDPQRIGVTGASGGGTQTFILCALDRRPTVAFPAVMVSTGMQGGCTCENCCNLRVAAGNVELAGLFAPRPLGMTTANDWTLDMPEQGFPQLVELYQLLGAADRVHLTHLPQFNHNYNQPSRQAMYTWFATHLGLDEIGPERDFRVLTPAELSVWDEAHPRPPDDPTFEGRLLESRRDDARRQLAAAWPRDPASLASFRRLVQPALRSLVSLPADEQLELDAAPRRSIPNGGAGSAAQSSQPAANERFAISRALLTSRAPGRQLPAILIHRAGLDPAPPVAIWLTSDGKQSLLDDAGRPIREVQRLVDRGIAVLGVDLFGQGEFVAAGAPTTNQWPDGARPIAGYRFGYNPSVLGWQVHDVVAVVRSARRLARQMQGHEPNANGPASSEWPNAVALMALDEPTAAAAAVAASQLDPRELSALAIDLGGFRFASVQRLEDATFFPGGAKYFDVDGFLAVGSPRPLWLARHPSPDPIQARLINDAYGAARCPERFCWVELHPGDESIGEQAAAWVECVLGVGER